MKILEIKQIQEGDLYTIANEPISSVDLMERAASKCTDWIIENCDLNKEVHIFAGVGNNGGDALVIARFLSNFPYAVHVYIVEYSKIYSDDFSINLSRLKKTNVEISWCTCLKE